MGLMDPKSTCEAMNVTLSRSEESCLATHSVSKEGSKLGWVSPA